MSKELGKKTTLATVGGFKRIAKGPRTKPTPTVLLYINQEENLTLQAY